MSKSITVKPKRGRPATGRDRIVGVRLPDNMIASLDKWAKRSAYSRSEAIRRLVEAGLATALSRRPFSKKTAAHAADMAERRIDHLGDPSASSEEWQDRKRKLLKGPEEFRELRNKKSRKR